MKVCIKTTKQNIPESSKQEALLPLAGRAKHNS